MSEPSRTNKKRIIETAKSGLLVVLLLSTILLLYIFWGDIRPGDVSIGDIGFQDETVYEPIDAKEVLIPDRIEISYGDGNYGIVTSDTDAFWYAPKGASANTFVNALKDFASAENVFLEEITKEQYEQVMAFESVKAVFEYYMPFAEFCDAYQINRVQGIDKIDSVSELAYSFGSMESVFLYDGAAGKYYRMVGSGEHPEESPFPGIYSNVAFAADIAYPLKIVVGDEAATDTPVPLPTVFEYSAGTYENEKQAGGPEFGEELAKTFFGDSFDFIRTIADDSGNMTYMYGYGQRIFIASNDGVYTYKTDETGADNIGYFEALENALSFVAIHGGLLDSSGEKVEICLADVSISQSAPKEYIFRFDVFKDKHIIYKGGNALQVQVKGGVVTYFERDFYTKEDLQSAQMEVGEATAANVLAKNLETMYGLLLKAGLLDAQQTVKFEAVSSCLQDIRLTEIRFPKDEEGGGRIETCWRFSFAAGSKKADMYFGAKDSEPLGYTLR